MGPRIWCCIISLKPIIAFSGVRSSWLMLARNIDFALLALANSIVRCSTRDSSVAFKCRNSGRECVGHGIKGGPEMPDLRGWILHPHAGIVVAVTPLCSDVEQAPDRFTKEPAGSENCRQSRCEQTHDDKCYSALGCVIDGRKRFGFRLPGAEEEILWRQCGRDVSENSRNAIHTDGLFPSRGGAVHDRLMTFSHVLSDERLGIWQPSDDVALAIGDQDR